MKNRTYAAAMLVLSCNLVAVAACGGGGNQNATVAAVALTQTAVPTATAVPRVAPSPRPVPPSPTPAPPSPTSVPPSATPLPLPSPTPVPAADRFDVAGLTEKQAGDFLVVLQAAVAEDNRGQVADLVAFPIDVTLDGARVTLQSKQQFIANYPQIITPAVKAAILGQTVAELFVNWQGVMIGDGEVWLGGVGDGPPFEVKVIAINNGTAPPPAGQAGPVRLSFKPGGTSAAAEGTLEAGGVNAYVINAMAGQTMMVSIDSPKNYVLLTVYGVQDGQPLIRAASGATNWTGTLPRTQDYMIEAVSAGPGTTYRLQVVIPARIKFAPGATSALVNGTVSGGAIVRYLLRAMAGQTMTVTITSPGQDVLLTMWGLVDGQPLVRSVSGATSWTGVLPATQDYVIDAVSVGGNTTYTMEVTVK